MKKKKLFAVVAMSLAILMTASLSGCGKRAVRKMMRRNQHP